MIVKPSIFDVIGRLNATEHQLSIFYVTRKLSTHCIEDNSIAT